MKEVEVCQCNCVENDRCTWWEGYNAGYEAGFRTGQWVQPDIHGESEEE